MGMMGESSILSHYRPIILGANRIIVIIQKRYSFSQDAGLDWSNGKEWSIFELTKGRRAVSGFSEMEKSEETDHQTD